MSPVLLYSTLSKRLTEQSSGRQDGRPSDNLDCTRIPPSTLLQPKSLHSKTCRRTVSLSSSQVDSPAQVGLSILPGLECHRFLLMASSFSSPSIPGLRRLQQTCIGPRKSIGQDVQFRCKSLHVFGCQELAMTFMPFCLSAQSRWSPLPYCHDSFINLQQSPNTPWKFDPVHDLWVTENSSPHSIPVDSRIFESLYLKHLKPSSMCTQSTNLD